MKRATTRGLPLDVWIGAILPRLSLRSLAVARCVCKQWQSAVFNLWQQPHLVIGLGELKIGVLMQKGGWEAVSIPEEVHVGTLCCVSEGLFCFSDDSSHAAPLEKQLVVGNPFTNRWKRLPSIPLPAPPSPLPLPRDLWCLGFKNAGAIGMIAHPVSSSYTILVLAATEKTCFAFEYASSSSSWSLYQHPLVQGCIPACQHINLTFLHGKAYYMGFINFPDFRRTLVSYDMTSHSWELICIMPERVPVGVRPSGFQESVYDISTWDQAQLVSCNDELRLVGVHPWCQSRSFLKAWSYWSMQVGPNLGLILDSMESIPRHPTNRTGCPLHRCVEFAIVPSYSDSSLSWIVFNHPKAKTVCYDFTTGSATARFEPPGGKVPLINFKLWTCSGAFHQPLLWNAPL